MRPVLSKLTTRLTGFVIGLTWGTGVLGLPGLESKCAAQDAKITFEDHIKPILTRRCSSCHNSDRTEGDLNVVNFVELMQGGGSGEVIEPFSAEDSFLIRLVAHEDSPEMPPGGSKIPEKEISLLKRWVDQGALENVASKAKKRKPKVDLTAVAANPNQRPQTAPTLPRLSLEPKFYSNRKSQIRSIAINPWSPIAAIALPRQVLFYDTQSYQYKGALPFPGGNPEHLQFSRNGSLLLMGGGVGGASGKVVLWDVSKGEVLTTIGDELDAVLAADISPDHKWVALGGPKKVVRVYSVADATLRYQITDHTQWITAIEFSPDGKSLATADRNGGIIVSDALSGNADFNLTQHKQNVTALSWRSDGKILASVSEDTSIRLWSSVNGSQVKTWNAHGEGITDVTFTDDGRLVTTGRDNTVKLWQQNGKQEGGSFDGFEDIGMALGWCGETRQLVAGDWRGNVMVWKPGNPKPIAELDSNPSPIADRLALLPKTIAENRASLKTSEATLALKQSQVKQLQQRSTKLKMDAKAKERAAAKAEAKDDAEVKDDANTDGAKAEKAKADDAKENEASKAAKKVAAEEEKEKLKVELTRISNSTKGLYKAIGRVKKECEAKRAALEQSEAELKFWKAEAGSR